MTGTKKGGEQSPPRGGKRQKSKAPEPAPRKLKGKTKACPPIPNIGYRRIAVGPGKFFTADDVADFARHAGITMLPASDLAELAKNLNEAFHAALRDLGAASSISPPSAQRDWFKAVHQRADDLLRVIGYGPAKDTLTQADLAFTNGPGRLPEFQIGLQALVEGRLQEGLIPPAILLPEQVTGPFKHLSAHVGDRSPIEVSQEIANEIAKSLLELSPWLIALIAEIGRTSAEFYGANLDKGGDKKDLFKDKLFRNLSDFYELMTGAPPSGMRGSLASAGVRLSNAPPVLWVQAVLKRAGERAPEIMKHSPLGAITAIRDLAEMRPATIIDRFKSVKTFEKPRKKAKQSKKRKD